ncbi:major royal jelly protein 3-like [Gigantopelta aegis]|uniref:major royal jelly protein 3-like n=1 Tax=Gigantopelta aegis TaxID=1735272 RepID=UPI001B88DECB|nr:major royal jelly protein 3-like [Gigantopelta aegis]
MARCFVFLVSCMYILHAAFSAEDNKTRPSVVYKWTKIDYNWPNKTMRKEYIIAYDYYAITNVISGIAVYKNDTYVTVTRISQGVPSAVNKIIEKDGEYVLEPYPSWEMNKVGNCDGFQAVQNIIVDPNKGWMWIIDHGRINTLWGGLKVLCPPKLIVYDMENETVVRKHVFPDNVATHNDSFFADIVIDPESGWAFITNNLENRLVFYSFDDDVSYSFSHKSFLPEIRNHTITVQGSTIRLAKVSAGVDGIAMSPQRDYILYSPLGGYGLYQLETKFFTRILRNASLTLNDKAYASILDRHISRVGNRIAHSRGLLLGQKNLFYGGISLDALYSWEVASLLSLSPGPIPGHVPQIKMGEDAEQMRWVDSLTIDTEQNLWFTSSKFVRYLSDSIIFNAPTMFIWKVYVGEDSYLKPYNGSQTSDISYAVRNTHSCLFLLTISVLAFVVYVVK